ncbi:MAG: DUF2938 domain-containing protein [Spongiibacteraceae bacterium]
MNNWEEIAASTALIGIGATAVMDAWLVLLKKLNIPTLNFALLGRWIGHVLRGQWFHQGMAKSAPIRHELAIGWLAHYGIGTGFGALHIALFGVEWLINPTFAPAITTGIATVAAPLFIMQPAMGSGIASVKTPTPIRNCIKSLINHSVFGCGIYLTGVLVHGV